MVTIAYCYFRSLDQLRQRPIYRVTTNHKGFPSWSTGILENYHPDPDDNNEVIITLKQYRKIFLQELINMI